MENRVKELQRHVSEMTDEIRKINALLQDFTNCKSCIRKLYKAPPDRVNSPVFTVPPVPVAEEHRDTPPRSIITSISTLQKPQASTPKTSSINEVEEVDAARITKSRSLRPEIQNGFN